MVVDEVRRSPQQRLRCQFGSVCVDMLTGIIDPVKVVRTALTGNAASIAGLLTTEAMVTTFDNDDKDKRRVEGSVR